MKTEKVIGTFDCRIWKKDTPKAARQMVAQGDRINLSVGFEEADLTDEMKEFARLHEKSGKYYINVKVFPKSCKIYTASARQVDFPDYKSIDGGRFEVIVDFTIKQNENKNIKQSTDNLVSVVFRTTYYSMDILLKPYSRCGLKPYSGAKGNEANH